MIVSETRTSTEVATPEPVGVRALDVMREALENQRLCEPSLDVEASLAFAVSHPNTSAVDSLATVEILSSLDSVFGTPLPKQILNHESLTTLSGLTKSLQVLEARQAGNPPAVAGHNKGGK
jgi:acyl carrier protein